MVKENYSLKLSCENLGKGFGTKHLNPPDMNYWDHVTVEKVKFIGKTAKECRVKAGETGWLIRRYLGLAWCPCCREERKRNKRFFLTAS